MDRRSFIVSTLATGALLWSGRARGGRQDVVNVYSARHYGDEALYRAFTERTGIEVQLLEGKHEQIIQRLIQEGAATPADVLITVDASRLYDVGERGLLRPVRSEALEKAIPAYLRHPEGLWWGVAIRRRIVVYARGRVDPDELRRYEDLADPRWKGRVLVRSGTNPYNISFVAWMIARLGLAATEEWCRGFVANFARPPQGGDTDQIRAVAAGFGDLALVNEYYLARLRASDKAKDREVAEAVDAIFPDQEGSGVHVNVTGVAVTRHAPHPDNGLRFLEYLASPPAQRHFTTISLESPANPEVEPHPALREWVDVKMDTTNIHNYARFSAEAVKLMDRCGWR